MCSRAHFIVTHVFPFPMRAPMSSIDLFHVSDSVHGSLYITCIVIYPVPQSEYRLCSPLHIVPAPSTSFPFEFDSPLASPPSVLPGAGLGQAGFASGSETTRKPQALFFLLVPPGQKHNTWSCSRFDRKCHTTTRFCQRYQICTPQAINTTA
jgi:hypothetical protein